MATPWAPARSERTASRWLDDSRVALSGRASGQALVSVSMDRDQGIRSEVIGTASVSGSLNSHQVMAGEAHGTSSASGILGYLYEILASSGGSATASGSMLVGQRESIAGESSGRASVSGDLRVASWPPRPSVGEDAPDNEVENGQWSGRSGLKGRRIFSPYSIGRSGSVTR